MPDGKLINNSNEYNLTANQEKNGMFNFLKTETITTNEQPKIMAYTHCPPKYSCDEFDLRHKRVYKAHIRQPIRAVRKETNCNQPQCQTTMIYKDHYSGIDIDTNTLATNCPNTNGSFPTGKLNNINLDDPIKKSQSGITTRTRKPLIRSGMQPNTAGQQNSGLSQFETVSTGLKKRNTYSYSFRELLNNRRKSTIEKSLACTKHESSKEVNGYGGQCSTDPNCPNDPRVIDRLNNNKFYKQGSVDSSTRLERLKLDTIKGQSHCPLGTCTTRNGGASRTADSDCGEANNKACNQKAACEASVDSPAIWTPATKTNYSKCNGPNVPFVRAQMGPPSGVNNFSCTNQRKYKGLININHTEVNYPQTSALARVRGAVSHKTTVNPNGGVCCNNDPSQFLK